MSEITLAAKCAPQEDILSWIKDAGIKAVELYLSGAILKNIPDIVKLCRRYPLRYAIHAPNDVHAPERLAEMSASIGVEIAVFHNIYFDDEWESIANIFGETDTEICIENVSTVLEPLKFMRRHGLKMCLDLEHIQIECSGVYKEGFEQFIKRASHVHMSGYVHGTENWHTHIHHSPEHATRLLDMLTEMGYSGWVVSEARCSFQTYEEFKALRAFFDRWAVGPAATDG